MSGYRIQPEQGTYYANDSGTLGLILVSLLQLWKDLIPTLLHRLAHHAICAKRVLNGSSPAYNGGFE